MGTKPSDRGTAPLRSAAVRAEAFSDAVIAIILTLMAVELLGFEPSAHRTVLDALLDKWPQFTAFMLSFFVVGQMWLTHHNMCRYFRAVDHGMLILNLALLCSITLIPFGAKLIAAGLVGSAQDLKVAAAVYATIALIQAILFNLVLWRARSRSLFGPAMTDHLYESIRKRFLFGPSIYFGALLLSFISPYVSLACYVLVAALYIWPAVGDLTDHNPP